VKVFVCHSAIGDAAAKRLVDAVQAALEPECPCFVDWTELEVGKPWRESINLWLEHCDAAVVVLNHQALTSSFVAYEVSHLMRRREDGQGAFTLIPIHVKNSDSKLSVGYANLQTSHLGPWQLHSLDAEIYDPAVDPGADATVARIKAKFARVAAARVPLPPQLERMVELLAAVPDALVKNALEKVGERARVLRPLTDDDRTRLALALRSGGLDQARHVIQEIRGNLCDSRNHWTEQHLSQLYELLAQFWVSPQAAATLKETAAGAADRRNVAIAARHRETAEMHILRACPKVPLDNEWMIASVQAVGGEELGDDAFLAAKVRTALIARLTTSDEDLDEELRLFDGDGNPVFVTLPPAPPLPPRVSRLRSDFPSVTFVYLTRAGSGRTDDSRVRHLTPAIEERDEDAFYDGYKNNWRLLKPRCR